ncbi:MarR family winged helix-turn-helix transcriptional regulator [Streptomyces lasiicapitis]|uniref:MarR family winged helix-turn-helix transcriptional regulator n=1 Tax=Streptomyces lasiicapitis TaxID=1923961 RepID=UPI0036967681
MSREEHTGAVGGGEQVGGGESVGGGEPVVNVTVGEGVAARPEQDLLTRTALGVFRLNGQFVTVSEEMARPAGLTAAWWQVLGAVLRDPQPVAGIARTMGITRQSVQRVADLLVRRGLAEYAPNPAHRRAKLLRPTAEGRAAVQRIQPAHADLATRLKEALGEEQFAQTAQVLERLSEALAGLEPAVTEP